MTEINQEEKKSFGEKFNVETCWYDHVNNKVQKKSIPIKSDQMIQALNYLRPYISRGVFPELGNDKNHEMTGLYSFIADREEFDGIEGDFFNGFISLKQYHHLYEYEIYHNPEDKIKIYVYLDEFNMNTESSKYKVKPNKAYSFYIN